MTETLLTGMVVILHAILKTFFNAQEEINLVQILVSKFAEMVLITE